MIMSDKFLFITSTNNSGSTVLLRFLEKCRNVLSLYGEGQYFAEEYLPVPVNFDVGRIWTEKAEVFADNNNYNWPEIKSTWESIWKKDAKYNNIIYNRVFVEKSAPNVLRAELLAREFENSYFIIMVRNPYAVTEGIKRQKGYSTERCINHWIASTKKQIENINSLKNNTWFTYENLCENPGQIEAQIKGFIPELADISFKHEIKVNPLEIGMRTGLKNFNEAQISKLLPEDIAIINSCLSSERELLNYFGYEMI
jgi:hypothetical protein